MLLFSLFILILRSDDAKFNKLLCIVVDGSMYAADNAGGRILSINLTTLSVTELYRAPDDIRPYTVAASQQYTYFSAWNRKLVCVLLQLIHCSMSVYVMTRFA